MNSSSKAVSLKVPNHVTRKYKGIVLERMKCLPPGGKMGDLPKRLQHESFVRVGEKKSGGPNMRLLRLELDKPSLTVTAYIFNKFVHPDEHRYITPREAACLQDFPWDYEFKGTLGQVHKQIGNAVPCLLGRAMGTMIIEYMRKRKLSGEVDVASYFTGAGGLDIGLEMASSTNVDIQLCTRFCSDIEQWAVDTVKHNRPEWNCVQADIRALDPNEIKKKLKSKYTVVVGGPPCQPFSVAGKQRATSDPLGILYRDYIRHVSVIKPELVIMENVYGLAQVKSANMIDEIYKSFNAIGYDVTHKELLAADYGTPQMRRRLFFVAAKKISLWEFPSATHWAENNFLGYPVYNGAGNAIKDLPKPLYCS
jgi:DNA (cytosine-5)-methyltransferase 1